MSSDDERAAAYFGSSPKNRSMVTANGPAFLLRMIVRRVIQAHGPVLLDLGNRCGAREPHHLVGNGADRVRERQQVVDREAENTSDTGTTTGMIGAAALPAVVFRPGYGPMKSRMNAK